VPVIRSMMLRNILLNARHKRDRDNRRVRSNQGISAMGSVTRIAECRRGCAALGGQFALAAPERFDDRPDDVDVVTKSSGSHRSQQDSDLYRLRTRRCLNVVRRPHLPTRELLLATVNNRFIFPMESF